MSNLYDKLLVLPEVGEVVPMEQKRYVQDVDVSLLKGLQGEHFNSLRDFVNKDGFGFILLEGYAGTGKTFLISMVVEWILKNRKGRVAMTAPTNKAVKVLKNAGQYQDPDLHYATIHSLLGLREQVTPKGEQIFIQLSKEHAKIGEFDILVVDEVSMLSDELLLGAEKITGIFDYVKMLNLKVIFVGDPCQIPPIGKENCLPFIEEKRQQYGIDRLVLTEIVRQSQDNPIIKVTLEVRKALGRDVVLPIRNNDYNEETLDGVYFLDGNKKEEFWNLIETYFTSENFQQRADFAKVVCYTNNAVRIFNSKIRKFIYGPAAPKICIGEKLIANKPIASTLEDTILFSNNDEFEVVEYKIETSDYKGAELTYYDTIVKDTGLYSDKTKKIKIIHESSQDDYKLILDHLAELAKAAKGWEASNLWKDFFRIQEVFADVSYNYAITAHKAQGSTYDNAFVLEADMDINRKIKERNRIKYTAFTRPKYKLFVIE